MKNTKNTFIKTMSSMLVIFAITCAMSINAQGGPPPGEDDTVDNQGDSIPLDGGLSILLAGAAFFGIKKLRDNKKAIN